MPYRIVDVSSNNARPINWQAVKASGIDAVFITGTGTPTITFFLERQGADGNWYPIWSPTAITTTGITSTSVGPGCATDAVVTENIRLRWTVSGTTPSFTTSISIIAR